MTAGIYAIKNTQTAKVYIGSSKNIEKRFVQHKASLKKGLHHSYKLQNAWDEYGESAFEFSIIQAVESEANLFEIEQQFIDEYKSWQDYNVCKEAGIGTGRPRSSDRIRKQFLLTEKHLDILEEIAADKNIVISQGSYKGQLNVNGAIIWLIENHKGEPNISRWLDDKYK